MPLSRWTSVRILTAGVIYTAPPLGWRDYPPAAFRLA